MTCIKLSCRRSVRMSMAAVAVALALSACGGGSDGAQQAQGGQQQLPVVGVVTVRAKEVTISTTLSGRLEAHRSSEVRAQVSGIIQRRLFEEGSYVRAGQPLYQLDSAAYAATLESARAQLSAAQAALAKANADLARYRPLMEADAVSKLEYDAAVAAQRSAQASVSSARAAIRSAQVNVNHARITAPISGYIGRSEVSEGNLVSAGGTTVLARIQQTHPMYVNVTQSATDAMKLRRDIAEGRMAGVNGAVEVEILLEDGSVHPQKGRLLFADPTVDETTGQVALRVEVPNEDNILLPGLYVRVNLPQAQLAKGYEIPQRAVTRGQTDTVLVVAADGSMQPKPVTVVGSSGSNWIISSGLNDGDKVIVDGTMIAGITGAAKVQPKEVGGESASASAPAAGQPSPVPASVPVQAAPAASEAK